jgi:S-adenosylmethionine:tRNA ribosyltransferase-isomerase
MRTADFDFDLPDRLIALRPAAPRDAARLLVVSAEGASQDRAVSELPGLLRPGDALVFNDTRVLAARLTGLRRRGEDVARIEATLHQRKSASRWTVFARPGKRLKVGDRIDFADLSATVEGKAEGGEATLAFDVGGDALDRAIARVGVMPLPPYIASRRPEDDRDETDYQTVYAREPRSVAAPTAGLHFTTDLIDRLIARGVSIHFVTLHVGAGTFLPVKSEAVADHRMHAEFGEVSPEVAEALNAARAAGGRIVCVGTTSLRLLESAADADGRIQPFAAETAIFITPGYRFRAADGLMTNFHLPRSTLFMLVCAFSGQDRIRAAYAHAIAEGYRFYSYGDASLLWRADGAGA